MLDEPCKTRCFSIQSASARLLWESKNMISFAKNDVFRFKSASARLLWESQPDVISRAHSMCFNSIRHRSPPVGGQNTMCCAQNGYFSFQFTSDRLLWERVDVKNRPVNSNLGVKTGKREKPRVFLQIWSKFTPRRDREFTFHTGGRGGGEAVWSEVRTHI